MKSLPEIYLKPFEEKRILKGHPWIYKSEIKNIPENIIDGDIVLVRSGSNEKIGIGYLNRKSEIMVRMLDIVKSGKKYYSPLNMMDFLKNKIIKAVRKREKIDNTQAKRLFFSEADGIPGLIIDQYKNYLVIQVNTLGIEKLKKNIIKILLETLSPDIIYEKSISPVRRKEGLEPLQGVIYPEGERMYPFVIEENGVSFNIDVATGSKTGFYIDQRENREKLKNYVEGKKVLDCFCYTGGFGCYALKYGAKEVIGVDSSQAAIKTAEENMQHNNFKNYKFINRDCFEALKIFIKEKEKFDIIILDPPAFSKARKEKKGAIAGYITLISNSLKILNENGKIFIFSCSHNIDYNDILFCIKKSEIEVKCKVKVIEKLKQSKDHPVVNTIPETFYLRGLTLMKQ